MKLITAFLSAFCFAMFVFAFSNNAAAKDSTSVIPKNHPMVNAPSKTTSCRQLNQFVTQCFTFYASANSLRSQMETLFNMLPTMQPSQVDDLLAQLKMSYENMKTLLPQAEGLITSAPDLFNSVKTTLPIFEYPKALGNVAAATRAIKFSVEDIKYMVTTTVPSIKALLGSKKKPAGDDSSLAVTNLNTSVQ